MKFRHLVLFLFIIIFSNSKSYSQDISREEILKKLKFYDQNVNKIFLNDSTTEEVVKFLEISEEKNYLLEAKMASVTLGQRMLRINELDKCIYFSKKIIKYGKLQNNDHDLAVGHHLLFKVYTRKSNYPEALRNALIAESYYETSGAKESNGILVNSLAFCGLLIDLNDFNRAKEKITKFHIALTSYNGHDKIFLKGAGQEIEGLIHIKQKNYYLAENSFRNSLETFESINHSEGIHSAYINLGVVNYELGNHSKSIPLLSKSIRWINESKVNKRALPEATYYLSKNYILQKKYDQAIAYLDISIKSSEELNNSEFFVKSILEKIKILDKKSKTSQIEKLLYKTLEHKLFLDYANKDEYFLLLLNLKNDESIKIKEIIRSYQQVFQYHQSEINDVELNKLDYLYDYQKVKDSLTLNKQEILNLKVKERKRKERSYWIMSLIVLVVLIIVIVFISKIKTYKLKNQKNMVETKLIKERKIHHEKITAFKNQKLTEFAIHVNQKNDILKKIKGELKKLSQFDTSIKTDLYHLISFISGTIKQSNEHVQIFKDADKISDNFLTKLISEYPTLNKQERRIITYIRLGLSSKQIADQIGITHNTVENYRFKIRKKINLSRDVSLKDFISKI